MIESTRDRIVDLLRGAEGATIADLADSLGLGQASIRRHLDHLRADGLVDARADHHGVGRPAFSYFLTEEAEERAPAGYSRLLSRLYAGLRSLDEDQVRGRAGADVLRTTFEMAAEQVAQEHQGEVKAESLERRVAQTSDALHSEGIIDTWLKDADGFHLTNTACPYRQAATATRGPCELDRRTIELLIAAPVRQISRIVDGKATCEYVVAPAVGWPPEEPAQEEQT